MKPALLALLTACCMAAPVAAAPQAKKARPPASVEVHNKRSVELLNFALFKPGEDGASVAKLAKPIHPGQKAPLKLTKAGGCEYLARWEFEDASDEATVDLCVNKSIMLTE